MTKKLMYVELKSGFSDDVPAWIGYAGFSKTGQTVYFDGKSLKKLKIPGIGANHYDLETGDEYWVSGVKKAGGNRHWAGSGKIMIDEKAMEDYLKEVNFTILDKNIYEIVNLKESEPTEHAHSIENKKQ